MAEGFSPIDKGGGGDARAGPGGLGEGARSKDNGVGKVSYSERLKTNVRVDQRLKRNILEISLERTDKEAAFAVDTEDATRVLKTLGIDMITQVQGHQIQHKGQFSVISVWMTPGISLDRFCKDVSIRVTDGVMTGVIRPAGKKDVTVTIVGLDFNTPDTFVFDYLSRFGKVMDRAVIYSKYTEGSSKGKYNGERKFQVDFSKSNIRMGTFHIIDGCKVRVYYRGNIKTCGRCHRVAADCPGAGLARDCEAGNGARVFLSDHMKRLWDTIGFVPTNFELEDEDRSTDDVHQASLDLPNIREKHFSPKIKRPEPTTDEIERFDGITIKNIPKSIEDKDLFDFLFQSGVPDDHGIENIRVNKGDKNTWVIVDGLETEVVQKINKFLHFPVSRKKFFNVPIYCRPLRNMTPMKPAAKVVDNSNTVGEKESEEANQMKGIPGLTRSQQKKALRKAQSKRKDEDKKEAKKDGKMNRSSFLKSPADDFVFNDDGSSSDDETEEKGFFTKSPNDPDTPALLKYRIPPLKRQLTSPLEGNQKSRARSEI